MKKSTFFFLSFLFTANIAFTQNISDEYGSLNSNRYLSGLGIAASFVNVPYHSQFELIVKGTVEMWIYPTSYSGSAKTLISKGATTNVSFLWGLSSSTGIMYFRIGSTDFLNTGGTAPPLNQWSHVAVTWSGGPNFTVKFYLNGAQTGSNVANSAAWYLSTDAIRIGGSQGFPGNAFMGNIDEVRLWSSENSASKIAESRFVGIGDGTNANSSGQLTTNSYYSGLICSWTFNTTGTTAADNISGFNGTYVGSAVSTAQTNSTPLPYNFALKLGGGSSDYIVVPHNSNFNQTTDGTLELWFYPISFTTEQILISKGASPTTISFILGVAPSTGKLYFGSGTSIAINSTGAGLTLNTWNHIAVTWATSGSNFIVSFYKNGSLNGTPSTIVRTFPTNTDAVFIGNSQAYNLPAKGYIDELRLWNPVLTQEQIRDYMFVSCRAISNSNLLAAWNFDGNLNSFAATSGITGSFNTGSANNCRFSGYSNDGTSGAFGTAFISHTTVINRTGSPNPFPSGFQIRNPFLSIPDNNPAGVSDSLMVVGFSGTLTSIEVFVSVQHTFVNDLTISLKAPNGQTRNLVANNGGAADNILSFFGDNFTYLPNSTEYLPPWGFVRPITPFNQFGGTQIEGTWTIKCVDNAAADIGVLRGWGIRFNNFVLVEPVSGNVPTRYNLYQNYPNPFNPVTYIKFDIPKDEYVTITLFDILGRETSALINEFKKAGSYSVRLDGLNLSSGTYFYRINAGDFVDTKKMVLVK